MVKAKTYLAVYNLIKNKIFKYFSILLLYPNSLLKKNIREVYKIIENEKLIQIEDLNKLILFINYIEKNDLIKLQENYVYLFDRQKKFSLYLFEHIHGDSKSRGMAMIDLKNFFFKYKIKINEKNELPDYIPVFLEFLSLIDKKDVKKILNEIVNILSIIRMNLEKINNPYSNIFSIIENLSEKKADNLIINKVIKKEKIKE
jgi:nitrate reductase delta subunit